MIQMSFNRKKWNLRDFQFFSDKKLNAFSCYDCSHEKNLMKSNVIIERLIKNEILFVL